MSYCTRTDIDAIFGTSNVSTWADLENKQSPQLILARVTEAIATAQDAIDNSLRGGPYTIPFTTIPAAIKNVCAALAGLWLYESRGVVETNSETGEPMHRYSWKKTETKTILKNIRAGGLRLDLPTIATIEPKVVDVDIDNENTTEE